MAKKKGNNYIVDTENNIARIELHRRNEESLWTIIDLEDLDRVINFPYTWFAKLNKSIGEYYVYASEYRPETKRCKPIFLHQFIMNANGKIVAILKFDFLLSSPSLFLWSTIFPFAFIIN